MSLSSRSTMTSLSPHSRDFYPQAVFLTSPCSTETPDVSVTLPVKQVDVQETRHRVADYMCGRMLARIACDHTSYSQSRRLKYFVTDKLKTQYLRDQKLQALIQSCGVEYVVEFVYQLVLMGEWSWDVSRIPVRYDVYSPHRV